MRTVLKTGLITGLLALLAACASSPPAQTGSRYSIQQDRAPSRTINIADIPEVVPEPVVRTQAGNRSPYSVLGKTYYVMATEEGYNERGVASWYGEKFHGHRTSNGEVFDMFQVSAAHKSLPIPSFLRVTNLDNNRSIVVRVNDRGPFHGDRVIDLSYAAALKLGFAERGTARVQLEALMPPRHRDEVRLASAPPIELPAPGSVQGESSYLQVGAFADRRAAEELSGQLRRMTTFPVFIASVDTGQNRVMHRVRVGPIDNEGELRRIRESVVAANLGSPYTVQD